MSSDAPDGPMSQSVARERWDKNPLGIFETFRDLAITLIEVVARVHYDAKASPDQSGPLSAKLAPVADLFPVWLISAKNIWWATPIGNCLSLTEPIRVDATGNRPSRFDGACYLEVAIKFADNLFAACEGGEQCGTYAAWLRFSTARGDGVTDYLQSIAAEIRCECRGGMDSWRLREPAQADIVPDPFFVEVARKQEQQDRDAAESSQAQYAEWKLRKACELAASRVAAFNWEGGPLSTEKASEWVALFRALTEAANASGQFEQLKRVGEYLAGPKCGEPYQLAGRLVLMAVEGKSDAVIASNLRTIVRYNALRESLERVADLLQAGCPPDTPAQPDPVAHKQVARPLELLMPESESIDARSDGSGDLQKLAPQQPAESASDGPWSKPDSPKRWAKLFNLSWDTLKRRFDDGTIRHKKLSSKSYQIHVDDLPSA